MPGSAAHNGEGGIVNSCSVLTPGPIHAGESGKRSLQRVGMAVAEAQPRHIIEAVKRAVIVKVACIDKVCMFTRSACKGIRQTRFMDRPSRFFHGDHPVAVVEHALDMAIKTETAANLFNVFQAWRKDTVAVRCQSWCHTVAEEKNEMESALAKAEASNKQLRTQLQSLKKEIEVNVSRMIHAWHAVTVGSRVQSWCARVVQERDAMETTMLKSEESNKQLRTQLRSLDCFRGQTENELHSANEAVKSMWQDLNGKVNELSVTKAANDGLKHDVQKLNGQLATTAALVDVLEADVVDAKSEVAILEEQLSKFQSGCVVCMVKPASIAFVPCGHLVACQACAQKLTSQECPICRRLIVQKLHVFTP